MALTALLRRVFGASAHPAPPPTGHDDRIVLERDLLRYRDPPAPDALVHPAQVVELWYGCHAQHANSWRVVYMTGQERRHVDILDQDPLNAPLLRWLTAQLPGFDAQASRGLPRSLGEEAPVLLWNWQEGRRLARSAAEPGPA